MKSDNKCLILMIFVYQETNVLAIVPVYSFSSFSLFPYPNHQNNGGFKAPKNKCNPNFVFKKKTTIKV